MVTTVAATITPKQSFIDRASSRASERLSLKRTPHFGSRFRERLCSLSARLQVAFIGERKP
jgi:hypothetical protein